MTAVRAPSPALPADARSPAAPVRAVLHLENRPGVLSLLAGKPNASTFPITALQFTVRDPADPARDEHVALTDDELRRGLQYGPTPGAPPFIEWAYGLQRVAQGRERGEGWALAVGNGSQDLIYKVRAGVGLQGGCSRVRRLSLRW